MKVLEYGKANAGRATLFLHGFPGVRSKQNRDLAERAADGFGRRCFVPLYDGLGVAEGRFSFESCRDQIQSFAEKLLAENETLDLVGHSWGGYLALGLAAKHQERIERLILMSPLLHFFTLDVCKQAFTLTAEGNADLDLGNIETLAKEFHTLGNREHAYRHAQTISSRTMVSIFQAASDDTTPASYAEHLVNQFRERPGYEAVATDHSFLLNRPQALERVLTALA